MPASLGIGRAAVRLKRQRGDVPRCVFHPSTGMPIGQAERTSEQVRDSDLGVSNLFEWRASPSSANIQGDHSGYH